MTPYLRTMAESTRAFILDHWQQEELRVALEAEAEEYKCLVEGPPTLISEIVRAFAPTPGRVVTKLSPEAMCIAWLPPGNR
jgi:hypothetical protein